MLPFFIGFLTVVLVVVSLLLVFIVLMQRPKQEGLGAAFGGGVTDQMWGAQTTNVLQKGTVYLAVMFFVITMLLAVLVNVRQKGRINTNDIASGVSGTSGTSSLSTGAGPDAGTGALPLTTPGDGADKNAIQSVPGLLPAGADPITIDSDAPIIIAPPTEATEAGAAIKEGAEAIIEDAKNGATDTGAAVIEKIKDAGATAGDAVKATVGEGASEVIEEVKEALPIPANP